MENLEKDKNNLIQTLSTLTQNYNMLVEYIIGLNTYTPRPIPRRISYYTQDISTNFITLIASLGKILNREDIGYNASTGEFKIINFL